MRGGHLSNGDHTGSIAALYRRSTRFYHRSTAGREARGMFTWWSPAVAGAAVVAETVDRGFDWGSAAAGAGVGAAGSLLLVAFAAAIRHRGGNRS